MHLLAAIHTPKYEDFEYTYANNDPLAWIGDGITEMDRTGEYDVFYLDPDNIDYPPCPVGPTKRMNGTVSPTTNGHADGEMDGVKNGDVMVSVMVNGAL